MNFRHNPEAMLPRDDDGTGFVDPADLAYELDRRDDSDACAVFAPGDDE